MRVRARKVEKNVGLTKDRINAIFAFALYAIWKEHCAGKLSDGMGSVRKGHGLGHPPSAPPPGHTEALHASIDALQEAVVELQCQKGWTSVWRRSTPLQ